MRHDAIAGRARDRASSRKNEGVSALRRGTFHNTVQVALGLKKGTAAPTISEFVCGGQRRMPPGPLPSVDPRAAWSRPRETSLRATWLGHSTVLLEMDGARVLTDPVWGERASPVAFAGPKRFQLVPVPIAALPPLDAVVISHDHYDHLDYPTILELAKREVHWGTFNLAIHAWDEPAETLVERAPSCGARLVMPKLGEPIEPSHAEDVDAWWRPLARIAHEHAEREAEATSLPPPEDVPFPMD